MASGRQEKDPGGGKRIELGRHVAVPIQVPIVPFVGSPTLQLGPHGVLDQALGQPVAMHNPCCGLPHRVRGRGSRQVVNDERLPGGARGVELDDVGAVSPARSVLLNLEQRRGDVLDACTHHGLPAGGVGDAQHVLQTDGAARGAFLRDKRRRAQCEGKHEEDSQDRDDATHAFLLQRWDGGQGQSSACPTLYSLHGRAPSVWGCGEVPSQQPSRRDSTLREATSSIRLFVAPDSLTAAPSA